jgi:hypothetical protein
MAAIEQAIGLSPLESDKLECLAKAEVWERRKSKSMKNGRSSTTGQFDTYVGLLCERDLSRHLDSLNPKLGAFLGCLRQQNRDHASCGPDFLDVDVKGTDLGRYGVDLGGAFARDYRLFVKYHEDRGLQSQIYALVFRQGDCSWLVGWATQQEVSRAKYLPSEQSFTVPVSKLRDPEGFLQMYRSKP